MYNESYHRVHLHRFHLVRYHHLILTSENHDEEFSARSSTDMPSYRLAIMGNRNDVWKAYRLREHNVMLRQF